MGFDEQRWLGVVATAAIVLTTTPAIGETADELRDEIQALRAEQARIDELSRALEAKLQALEARAGAKSVEPPAAEPSRLAVSGDVRLRFQGDYADTADRKSVV